MHRLTAAVNTSSRRRSRWRGSLSSNGRPIQFSSKPEDLQEAAQQA